MTKQKGFIILPIVIIAIVLVAGGVGGYLYIKNKNVNKSVACTQEAKQCPDGSYVSRVAPKCEFAECPSVATSTFDTSDQKTYTNEKYGFSLNFPDRWIGYQVNEKDNCIWFSLEHKTLGYTKVFAICAYSKLNNADQIQKIKEQKEPGPVYLTENDQYAFVYATVQDDEGYVGFPDIVPNQSYKGPLYDVINKILPTFVDMSSWKTYQNSEYGFELRYPAEWRLPGPSESYLPKGPLFTVVYPSNDGSGVMQYVLTISISNNSGDKSLDSIIKDLQPNCENSDCFGSPTDIEKLDNLEGVKYKRITGDALYHFATILHKNSLINIELNTGGAGQLFDKILSTFKFINQ